MYQSDYVLRMIEMMGTLLRRIRDLLDESEKNRMLNEACLHHCGLPFDKLAACSSDTLCCILPENARMIGAELFYIRSETFCHEEEYRLKCLRLMLSLRDQGALCEARSARAAELEAELLPLLDMEDLLQCAEFFLHGGSYAEAEDAVFRAAGLADESRQECCITQGVSILQEALKAGETGLALCNLTEEELRDSIQELRGMMPPQQTE